MFTPIKITIKHLSRVDVVTDYKGIDITMTNSINTSDNTVYSIFELWDSNTGEAVAEGTIFETLQEAINWINI